jgi:diguanylate cyclase (GGDEF)-like protein
MKVAKVVDVKSNHNKELQMNVSCKNVNLPDTSRRQVLGDIEMNEENWDIMAERVQYLKGEVKKYKYDYLTGLKMRKDFDGYFRTLYEMYEFENRDFLLVLIDVDGLHNVNRNEGYENGDKLIKKVGKQLIEVFNDCNGSEVFRIGGDEFAVLVKGFNQERLDDVLIQLTDVTYGYTHISIDKDFGSPANVFKITDKQIIEKKLLR